MTLKEFYAQIGGNYEDTLHRLPSEALVHRFVLKYPADPSVAQLRDSVSAADWETAFRAAADLTEHLRGGKPLTEQPLMDAVLIEHERVMTAIEALG